MHLYSAARLAAEQSVVWIRSVTDCEKPLPSIDIVSFLLLLLLLLLLSIEEYIPRQPVLVARWSLVGRGCI